MRWQPPGAGEPESEEPVIISSGQAGIKEQKNVDGRSAFCGLAADTF